MATPPVMLAPARLCTGLVPAPSSTAAAIAALLVLPSVAQKSVGPSSRRPAKVPIAWGSRRTSNLPGRLVPPQPRAGPAPRPSVRPPDWR